MDSSSNRYELTRRALGVFLPLLLLFATINVALLVSNARQSHLQIEQTMLSSLRMLRDSSAIVEDAFAAKLEEGLQLFLAEYEAQKGLIEKVDLSALQHRLGNDVDLYAIDASGIVQYSTLAHDVGLDFRQWPDFYGYLESIRRVGELRIDSISKESKTGLFRKYAYQPTPDKRWILELGIKPEIIARRLAPFDPVLVAQRLVVDHSHLNRLRIIDRHGWQLSMTQPTKVEDDVFERVMRVLETRQVEDYWSFNRVLRYLPMPDSVGENAFGLRMQVVELDYNLNRIMFGVGVNLLIAFVAVVLVLRLTRCMKQSEGRLHAAREVAEAANLKLAELSATDGLTGIANRRRFDDFLALEWARSIRNASPLALLLLDVDHFKAFNDNYGHQAGDEVLRQVAQILRKNARRPTDLAARYGGEEFALIGPDTPVEAALAIAENIREEIASLALPHEYSTHGRLTVSIGLAVSTLGLPEKPESLIEMADAALYSAKHLGRNRVEVANSGFPG